MKNIEKAYEQQNDTAEDPIIKKFNKELPAGYEAKRESKNDRASVVMRKSTKEKLTDLATTRHTSRNDLINEILEEYLKTHDK